MPPRTYRIVVEGELGPRFGEMFEQMEIRCSEGETALVGPVQDQAQLRGILDALDGLGVVLLSVTPVQDAAAN